MYDQHCIPLLFNLHGYEGTSIDHLSADMRSLADQENFLRLSTEFSDSSGNSHWLLLFPAETIKLADDAGFFNAMIASSHRATSGSKPVYACGYSNGGMMSYFLGIER